MGSMLTEARWCLKIWEVVVGNGVDMGVSVIDGKDDDQMESG